MRALLSFVKRQYIFRPGRHVDQHGVQDRQRGHTLHDNDSSGNNHRIMASFDEQLSGPSVLIHRFLFPADGRCGFDISPQDQVGTVRDPAQDAARMVSLFSEPLARAAAVPSPISTALTAPIAMTADASAASSL